MTFREDFPSFREGYDMNPEILMISRQAVIAHCVDKQRLREAIDEEFGCHCVDEVEVCWGCRLKERLGL